MSGTKEMRTKVTDEKLNNVAEMLENMAKAVREMHETGDSMAKICNKYGINYIPFRSSIILAMDRYMIDKDSIKPLSEIEMPEKDPYLYLFSAISGCKYENVLGEFEIPFDLEDTIDEILNNPSKYGLTDRETSILKYRFAMTEEGDFKTLEEVGAIFGRTRDRIRQIEAKAIRKLRHPSRFKLIKYGKTGYNKQKEVEEAKLKSRIEMLEAKSKKEIDEFNKNIEEELANEEPKIDIIEYLKSNCISDIELSVRSYNCLKRAGINTLFDLCLRDSNQLLKVRNLGRKSYQEVIDMVNKLLSNYGYDFESAHSLAANVSELADDSSSMSISRLIESFSRVTSADEAKKLAIKLCSIKDDIIKEKTEENKNLEEKLDKANKLLNNSKERYRYDLPADSIIIAIKQPYPILNSTLQHTLSKGIGAILCYNCDAILYNGENIDRSLIESSFESIKKKDRLFNTNVDDFIEILNLYRSKYRWYRKYNN